MRKFLIGCSLIATVLAASPSPAFEVDGPVAAQSDDESSAIVESFEVQCHGDFLILPVTVADKTYSFVLDTGCTRTVFDSSLLHLFKRTNRTMRFNGKPRLLYESPTLRIGMNGMTFQGEVICANLEPIRSHTGYEIAGMIGMDFLRSHVVGIDFDRGTVAFLKSVPADAGVVIPITFASKKRPTVELSIGEEIKALCLVDTGSLTPESAHVGSKHFDDLIAGSEITLAPDKVPLWTIDGATESRWATGAHLRLGPFEWREQVVREHTETTIGLPFLSRFRVTFDFPGQQMYLKPGTRVEFRDRPHHTWPTLNRDERGTVIEGLDRSGAGYHSGLREWDRFLQIDGKDASRLTYFQIRRLLALDRPVPVRVERKWQELEFHIYPQRSQSTSPEISEIEAPDFTLYRWNLEGE